MADGDSPTSRSLRFWNTHAGSYDKAMGFHRGTRYRPQTHPWSDSMSEPFDVAVLDGGVATESPRHAVDRGNDPFSASSEARVHELVTGHRRHGLDTVIRQDAQPA